MFIPRWVLENSLRTRVKVGIGMCYVRVWSLDIEDKPKNKYLLMTKSVFEGQVITIRKKVKFKTKRALKPCVKEGFFVY